LDAIVTLLLGLLGVFSGFLGALLGVGGGVIVVPILILAFGFESRIAVGTSAMMVLFTALSGTGAYIRQKRIDWKTGMLAAVTTVPGAAIGAYLTKFFSSRNLAIIFGFTLFIMATMMIRRTLRATKNQNLEKSIRNAQQSGSSANWKRRIVDAGGNVFDYSARLNPGLPLLFFGGLASGFLGIGGGLVVVPILAGIIGLPIHLAVATSMLTMIFTSISSVSTHIMLGNVRIDYAIPLIIGILLGTQVGARTASRLKSIALERVFSVCMIGIGILLIVSRM
jgi:uncharacterized membrane protein YfcA